AEISGQVAADFAPEIARVVAAHDVPMLLHEESIGLRRVHGDVVDAVADFGVGIGNVLRDEAFVDGLPGFARVGGAESTGGGDRDIDTIGIFLVENDGVEAHTAGAGLPFRAGAVTAQSRKFVPVFAAIGGFEE